MPRSFPRYQCMSLNFYAPKNCGRVHGSIQQAAACVHSRRLPSVDIEYADGDYDDADGESEYTYDDEPTDGLVVRREDGSALSEREELRLERAEDRLLMLDEIKAGQKERAA